MAGVVQYVGCVGHLGLYGFLVDHNEAVLQCLFFEISQQEPLHVNPRTLLLRVTCGDLGGSCSDTMTSAFRDTYLSLLDREEGDRIKRIGDRNAALAYLLTRSNETVTILSRAFVPIVVSVVDGLEIISARSLDRPSGFYELLATLDVARIRAVGGYVRSEPCSSVTDVGSRLTTHASKKLRRACSSRELAFSVRVHGRKIVFDSTVDMRNDDGHKLYDLFCIRDVSFACRLLRLVTPKGFVAMAFADDQCLLLLREAITSLYRRIYSGFSGWRPLMDFVGPNFYREGGPRSVFFPGFPNMCVYSVPWGYRLVQETGRDAIDEILSECGLPEILGGIGKHAIDLISPPPTDLSDDEIGIFYSNVRRFRLNGNHFSNHESNDTEVLNIFVGDRDLYRVVIPDLRVEVLRRCVRERDFPLVFGERGRTEPAEICARFVEKLRHRSNRLYVYVRCLEGFISHHVTSVCASSGLSWVLVKNDSEFYVGEGDRRQTDRIETCVRTIFGCYWKRLFGSLDREPSCVVTEKGSGLLVALNNILISSFGSSGAGPDRCPHWTDVTGRFLGDCVRVAFKESTFGNLELVLREKMRNVILELAARRHEVSFWVEKFPPGKHVVEEHSGDLDCNEFSGIRLERGKIAVQSLETALHDDIGYETYVKKIFAYLRLCLSVVWRKRKVYELTESDETSIVDALMTWEQRLLSDYMILFKLN